MIVVDFLPTIVVLLLLLEDLNQRLISVLDWFCLISALKMFHWLENHILKFVLYLSIFHERNANVQRKLALLCWFYLTDCSEWIHTFKWQLFLLCHLFRSILLVLCRCFFLSVKIFNLLFSIMFDFFLSLILDDSITGVEWGGLLRVRCGLSLINDLS